MAATMQGTRTAQPSTITPTSTRVKTGHVVEIDINGVATSALVLLASGDAVILDPCDGSTPVVIRLADLGPVRVFDPR